MGVSSLPKTVTRHRRDCDLNPGPSEPESSTLITRLPSHPLQYVIGECTVRNVSWFCWQEAVLPQTDRATRCVSRNLVNCATVRTGCTTNAEQIVVIMEMENYGRPTCYKLCTSSKFASILVAVIHKLHRRRVLLTTRLICRGESLYFQSLGQNSLEKYPYFRRYPNFLITQHRIGRGSSRAKNQFNSFVRFDRTPTCDGRTGNHFSFGIIIVRLRCGYWFCTVRQKKEPVFLCVHGASF